MTTQNSSLTTKSWAEPDALEHLRLKTFFLMRGVRAEFMKDHPAASWTRRQIDEGLNTGSYRVDCLTDMRAYLEKHKAEFEQFLPKELPAAVQA